MKPLAPNTLLQNRYLVVQLIGKGGMGEVYLAVDQRLGSAMALKRTSFNDDEMLKAAFEREAKILAMLRHGVLPKVSDHFSENDNQYLVMEHISGDDLAKRLEAAKQPFPLSWVLFWADQLLDALAYLHGHEPPIIHRDIKPQNLKLTTDNHIILLDFGLAKNSIGETRLTTSGTLSGYTPHYASMEQIRGTGTTAQSDLYSLSATLYQLLTNVVPPDALARADAALNGMPDPVKPLYELNHEVSQGISDVIIKGMSLSAEKRYRNAREMQTALREAYAEMQSGNAQTVAFNTADVPAVLETPAAVPPVVTEQFVAPMNSVPANPAPPTADIGQATTIDIPTPGMETVAFNPPPAEPDYGATMQYDGPIGAGDKTEAFTNVPSYPPMSADEVQHEFHNTGNLNKNNGGGASTGGFDAGATVPLMSFNNQESAASQPNLNQTEENFVSLPPQNTEQIAPEAVAAATAGVAAAAPAAPPAKAKKKSGGGKIFLILGILVVLGVLGIAAAGVGIYLYKPELINNLIGATPTPTATPTPEPSNTPTPEPSLTPSVSPTVDTNANTNVNTSSGSNTNTSGTNTDLGNTRVEPDKTPRTVETPVNDRTPRPTPQVGLTPKPPTTPKPTPQKQPTRDPSKIL